MAQTSNERAPRGPHPTSALGLGIRTKDSCFHNLSVIGSGASDGTSLSYKDKRTTFGPGACSSSASPTSTGEVAASYTVTLKREGLEQAFDLKMGPCYGRTMWIGPSVDVTVTSASPMGSASAIWSLAPSGERPLSAADAGADASSSAELLGFLPTANKPLFCVACFKRVQSESDALNHFRDVHGPSIFKAAAAAAATSSSSPPFPPPSSPSSTAAGGGFESLVVAYDDDAFALVVKPQGLATLGEAKSLAKSAALKERLAPSTAPDALTKGRPVHRLDAPTGGLVIVAKTKSAVATLCAALA